MRSHGSGGEEAVEEEAEAVQAETPGMDAAE
jgi:hypothetical protein